MFILKFLLAHLLGDYVFQTNFMAKNKVRNDLTGWLACFIHCLVYSAVITAFFVFDLVVQDKNFLLFMLMIFATHFPIDKTSAAKYWLKLYGKELPNGNEPVSIANISRITIYWFVYIVVDNTFHLCLMALGIYKFFPQLMVN